MLMCTHGPDTGRAAHCPPAMIENEIRTLLDAPAAGRQAPSLAHIEDTLTAGYARALALEAERWRLERRIADVVTAFANEEVVAHGSELTRLAHRVKAADGDLANLRSLLASLRKRAAEVRAAA